MSDALLFPGDGYPDWRALRNHLKREGPVPKPQCMRLLKQILDMLKADPNLVQIDEPICVVGDIHG